MYLNGHDKKNRPVLYLKPGLDNTGFEHKTVKMKYLVYCMESAIQNLNEDETGNEKVKAFIILALK